MQEKPPVCRIAKHLGMHNALMDSYNTEMEINMEQKQYTLVKLPLKEIVKHNFTVNMDKETEISNGYLVAQGDSLLFDQIERLRGRASTHIDEVILVVAKKNPKLEKELKYLLNNGFSYNGIHYSRFGKSASQGKAGITAFVCDTIFDELYRITQMDIEVTECVISKYEAQRGLVFSSCALIHNYMPHIVIIGEYEKTLQNQLIKYVVEEEKEYIDKETGQKKTYIAKEVTEGFRDLPLSPFDGCGCHEYVFMEQISTQLGLDYLAIGAQIRLPFIKGYSVYVPFRQILKEWGYETITDIYGTVHAIDEIDCIWNTSMFKGHRLFYETYGKHAWTSYTETLSKYAFKLGISKYSHHTKDINRYTRMNFQYLQCLDLWNPQYINAFENKELFSYDILNQENDGKIISLAKYTTGLFEKIIKGDAFYTYKFMGMTDAESYEPKSKYLEAVLAHSAMRKDPAVRQFLYRKLKKAIEEAKLGKIYCSGFYHTGVGDMLGYLQYAVGEEPTGCLNAHELYSANFSGGEIVSFRSPLVDPSEVNRIKIARGGLADKYFFYFKNQDVVMFNMHDISAPQQGGADFDGDIFFLCDEPLIAASKIDKHIILDLEDKAAAEPKPYTKEQITAYEILTRDSRIGEITNAATSIENRYTANEAVKKLYADYASLLRIFQGKEIDFLKTGFRWHMNSGLKQHLKRLPYFLLFHYPDKLKKYRAMSEKNRRATGEDAQLVLNAYHSPSPMNELCQYLCAWEKKHILWDNSAAELPRIRALVLNRKLDLSDTRLARITRRYINTYADELRRRMELGEEKTKDDNFYFHMEETASRLKQELSEALGTDEEHTANYCILVSYQSASISKALAWACYSDYILKNIKDNADTVHKVSIEEVAPHTEGSCEYLGRYYAFTEEDEPR